MDHYTKLSWKNCKLLPRCIGWSKCKRTDRPVSFAEIALRTACKDNIEATVRKRRLCFPGFVMGMQDDRLSHSYETVTSP